MGVALYAGIRTHRKTKSGKLYNISFKYDSQTYAGKCKGSGFAGEIKLADFVDLETGEFV